MSSVAGWDGGANAGVPWKKWWEPAATDVAIGSTWRFPLLAR
jgi:hypothetical protein